MCSKPKKKCKQCRRLFHPDRRNYKRQEFCSRPQCRKASKRCSNRKWQRKPENQDYHRGPAATARVQRWRQQNPDRVRKQRPKSAKEESLLQDVLTPEPTEYIGKNEGISANVLQDVLNLQAPILIGLISKISGLTLQDSLADELRDLIDLGTDLINVSRSKSDEKTTHRSRPSPSGTNSL